MQRLLLGLAFTFVLAGCNTAELLQPPEVDSGTGLCDAAPAIACEAGGEGITCAADPGAADKSVAALPSGTTYPLACRIATQTLDALGCVTQSECTCVAGDGGDAGFWSCVK